MSLHPLHHRFMVVTFCVWAANRNGTVVANLGLIGAGESPVS